MRGTSNLARALALASFVGIRRDDAHNDCGGCDDHLGYREIRPTGMGNCCSFAVRQRTRRDDVAPRRRLIASQEAYKPYCTTEIIGHARSGGIKLPRLRAFHRLLFAGFVTAFRSSLPASGQQIPALAVIRSIAAAARPALLTQREALEQERSTLRGQVLSLNAECGGIDSNDSVRLTSCTNRKQALQSAMRLHVRNSEAFNDALAQATRGCNLDNDCTIEAMTALATRLGWSVDRQTRLKEALGKLVVDRGPNSTEISIRRVWQDVLTRGRNREIARAVAQGEGPGFPGAGTQTSLQDCAVYALANAAACHTEWSPHAPPNSFVTVSGARPPNGPALRRPLRRGGSTAVKS